jgi:hypothetical protein
MEGNRRYRGRRINPEEISWHLTQNLHQGKWSKKEVRPKTDHGAKITFGFREDGYPDISDGSFIGGFPPFYVAHIFSICI